MHKTNIINLENILIFSSLCFITNIITTFINKDYIYCFLFILLVITSLIYHSNSNIYTYTFDRIVVIFVILYGAYNLYNKSDSHKNICVIIVVILFLVILILYYYGYYMNKFCFHKNIRIANKYHSLLHLLSSVGHHLIII
jgi:hypothetical protein